MGIGLLLSSLFQPLNGTVKKCADALLLCPTVTIPLNASTAVCTGGTVNLNSFTAQITLDNPANPSLIGFEWYSDAALTQTLNTNTFNYTGFNTCEAQAITIYAAVLCSEQPQPIAAGSLSISVYPDPPSPFQLSDCSLTVDDVVCGGSLVIEYLQSPGVWASTPPIPATDGATALWRAYLPGTPDQDGNGVPDCIRSGTIVANNCPCIPPAAPIIFNDTISFCQGSANVTPFVASTSAGSTINWYNNLGTFLSTGTTFQPNIAGTYYAQSLSADGLCVGGQTEVTLLEAITDNASFSYPTNNTICVGSPTILPQNITTIGGGFSTIGGLSINSTTGAVTPNMAGTFAITYTTNGQCPDSETNFITIDACCPTVNSLLDESLTICGATAIDWTTYTNEVMYNDPAGNFGGFAWFSNAAMNIPISMADTTHSGSNCLPENKNLYLGVLCNAQSTPIAAGVLSLTIYPVLTLGNVAIAGGCSLQVSDNCLGTILIEYQQPDGTWATALPSTTPTEGQTALWRAYVQNTPDANDDGLADCLLTGSVTAGSCNCTPPTAPTALTDSLSICAGSTNSGAFLANVAAGIGIIWRNTNGDSLAVGNSFVPLTAGNYYAQSVNWLTHCYGPQTPFELVELAAPNAAFSYTQTAYCANNSTVVPIISGTAGGVFTATGGLPIDPASGAITLNISGVFNITYTVGNTCPQSSTVNLTINNNSFSIDAGAPITTCVGQETTLSGIANGAVNVEWYSDNGTITDPNTLQTTLLPSESGNFEAFLIATNACGVQALDSVSVFVQEPTPIVATNDTVIQEGSFIILSASGASSYVWQADPTLSCIYCSNPIAQPTSETTYIVSSNTSCVLPDSVTVSFYTAPIIIAPDTLLLPNAFSPNGDQRNDEFRPTTKGNISEYRLEIYGRWGDKLFETDNYLYGWDGRYKGKSCEIGTYIYRLQYRLNDNPLEVLQGYFTLIK